ncbi:MFS transporter [Sedimentibacter hydroxybenzoicus DSM 7310]|uniref:MFS transporter n=1 Tax=Sedimentibacter hydroxybenzoicus DSM 7310 TaxID=1123245 RepID=A0A974BHH5_SEDHY|nr:MFS transporter [Sedimentibacter hydroxybenzoicus]NYB72956.1 MFS transporter [Sedimentibacter hydroxybenzoicus DSM 7310]
MERNTKLQKKEPIWTRDFILISIASLFVTLGFQMLLPVLPVFSARIGGSDAWAGLVVGIFTVSAVIMRPVSGMLLDSRGRRGVFIIGLIVFLVCVVLYNWTSTILALLIIRFIHGFGWGASSTASSTIASDIVPKSRLAEGMGYFGLTSTLAMAVAPALGLGLLDSYGFNMVFNVSAVFVFICILISLLIKYHKPEVITKSDSEALPANIKNKIFEKSAITPATVIFFVTMTYGSIVSFIALYAEQRQVENIGLFFTVYAAALLISRPYFGRMTDKKGTSFAVLPGIVFVIIAMLVIYFADSLMVFLIAGFIYGIGFGAVQPALQAMSVSKAGSSRRGAANATFFLGFDLGIGAGAIIWGIIAESLGYQLIYLLSIIPAVVGILVYIKSIKKKID